MANPQHLSILRNGIAHWNNWRRENPGIHPDLSWTVLIGLAPEVNNFKGVDFSEANLEGVVLSGADLTKANFKGANLACAKLCRVSVSDADFTDANTQKAEITGQLNKNPEKEPPSSSEPELVDTDFASTSQVAGEREGGDISIAVAWDPEILTEAEYGDLIVALGDLVRSEGGVGVRRVVNKLFGVNVEAGVLV
jgi:hypothetical protein